MSDECTLTYVTFRSTSILTLASLEDDISLSSVRVADLGSDNRFWLDVVTVSSAMIFALNTSRENAQVLHVDNQWIQFKFQVSRSLKHTFFVLVVGN